MKTKAFLTVMGLIASQSLFHSCNDEDNIKEIQVENSPSEVNISNIMSDGGISPINYFVNPEPFNNTVNFVKSQISSQGASYVLNQQDLDMFYDEAQITANDRLPLNVVYQIVDQTLYTIQSQISFDEIVQNLNFSDSAKSLMIEINNNSISNIENNLSFQNLPALEKAVVNNFNNLVYNIEIGKITSGPYYKKGTGAEIGAKIGFVVGVAVGIATLNPVGLWGAVCGGSLVGAVIGKTIDDK